MNLIIDLGNTTSRIYIYDGAKRIAKRVFKPFNEEAIAGLLNEFNIQRGILSSVIDNDVEVMTMLIDNMKLTVLDHKTPLPIQNLYETPETLGSDRIACAVAAATLHPGKNVLVIDAGTCIKYDFVNSKSQYLGGAISPGFQMRFDALHHFTDKLPEMDAEEGHTLTGIDTIDSMSSGVFNGIVYEMNGFISAYNDEYSPLVTILTGGDAGHFADELNFPIFAEPDLTGIGLNEILLFNASRH